MSKGVLKHPALQFSDLVSRFKDSGHFNDFLVAAEFAIFNKVQNSKDLADAWERANVHSIDLQAFSILLTKFNVDYPRKPKEISDKQKAISAALGNDFSHKLRDAYSLGGRRKKYQEKYQWFEPSLVYGDLLSQVYPEEVDPGKIIGDHLKNLFPGHKPFNTYFKEIFAQTCDSRDPGYYDSHCVYARSDIHELLLQVGKRAIYSSNINQKDLIFVAFENIIDPNREFPSMFKIGDIFLAILLFAPKEFFYLWIERWFLDSQVDYDRSPEVPSGCMEIILAYGSFGKGNPPACLKCLPVENEDKQSITKNIVVLLNKKAHLEKFLDYETFRILCQKFSHSRDRLSEKASNYLRIIVRNFSTERKQLFNGLSLLNAHMQADISFFIKNSSDISLSELDLLLLLSFADGYDFGPLWLFENEILENGVVTQRGQIELNEKLNTYALLFDKSCDEGFPELGNAFLSLFVFISGVLTQGRLVNFPYLYSCIKKGLTLPGNEILKYTIEILCDLIEENYFCEPAAALVLRSFRNLCPKKGGSIHLLRGSESKLGEIGEIKENLIERIGKERWKKLSDESKSFLIDSELTWKKCAIYFGAGIKDWSGAIAGYCKVIETELVSGLSDIINSEEYKIHMEELKIPKGNWATVGTILTTLENYKKLSQGLKVVIDNSKILLPKNIPLISRIKSLNKEYRNVAAHKETFNMVKYAEFKEKFFDKRMLHDLIDHL